MGGEQLKGGVIESCKDAAFQALANAEDSAVVPADLLYPADGANLCLDPRGWILGAGPRFHTQTRQFSLTLYAALIRTSAAISAPLIGLPNRNPCN